MPTRSIDELMWLALTDPTFREKILNDRRREVVDGLGLNEIERQAVLAVKANTLEGFAAALCNGC